MAVTPETIAVALGRTAPDEDSAEGKQWEMWISDALMLIAARHSLDDLNPNQVDYVVREAVVAQIKRPDDATQIEIRVDDGSTSKQYKSGSGRVYIRDEWWDLLAPKAKSGAFSIIPGCSISDHLPWCSLSMGADYCSCGVDIAGVPIFELSDDE